METAAACAGLASARDLRADLQARVVFPTKFGGIIPGSEAVAPVSTVCAAANVLARKGGKFPGLLLLSWSCSVTLPGLTRPPRTNESGRSFVAPPRALLP